MGVRSRKTHAAGVASVALVAVARVARDVRPSRRVTCVHVPQRAPEAPPRVPEDAPAAEAAAAVEAAEAVVSVEPAAAVEAAAGPDTRFVLAPQSGPEPTSFWFEAPSPWEDCEVARPSKRKLRQAAEREAAAALAERDAASVVAELEVAPVTAREASVTAREPALDLVPVQYTEPDAAAVACVTADQARISLPADDATTPAAEACSLAPEPAPALEIEAAWGWSEPWSFEIPTGRTPRDPRRASSRPARRTARSESRWRHPAIALAALLVAVTVWIAVPRSPSANARSSTAAVGAFRPHPSAFALRTIPSAYLSEYWKVAQEYGLDWTKLAAVGQIESDQGRSSAPGVAQGTNGSGAAGPAQFLLSTWARYGVDADGRGPADPYDPTDAITAMAAYLKASGAPENWGRALYTYNHSSAYVVAVMSLSRRYLGPR